MNNKPFDIFLDWLLLMVTCAVIVIVFFGIGGTVFGDEWHDRAAAAIAIHNASDNPWLPPTPPAPKEPKPKAESRPVVLMYSASWCAPCQHAKAELREAKLPFDIKYVDVSNGGQPAWCESIPAFSWQHKSQTRYVLGFTSVARLIEQWKATNNEPQARSPPANKWPAMTGYKAQWTWPGDLRQHLKQTHGVSEAGQLTQDQAEALHDALHEGRSLKQIKAHVGG